MHLTLVQSKNNNYEVLQLLFCRFKPNRKKIIAKSEPVESLVLHRNLRQYLNFN